MIIIIPARVWGFQSFAGLISLTFTGRLGSHGPLGSWLACGFSWGTAGWRGLCRVCVCGEVPHLPVSGQ